MLFRSTALCAQGGTLTVTGDQDLQFGVVLPGLASPVSPTDAANAGRFEIRGDRESEVMIQLTLPTALVTSGGDVLSLSFGVDDGRWGTAPSIRSARVFDYFLHGRVRETLVAVTLTGLLTPGPLAAYLPVLKALRKLGFRLSLVAAFITSQTLVGPGRLFMEVRYFGAPFFVYRVLASFAIALAVGAIYALLERRQVL